MKNMRYCIRINIVSEDRAYAGALAGAIAATQSGFSVAITGAEEASDSDAEDELSVDCNNNEYFATEIYGSANGDGAEGSFASGLYDSTDDSGVGGLFAHGTDTMAKQSRGFDISKATDAGVVYLVVREDTDSVRQSTHGVISVCAGGREFSVVSMYAGCAAICREVRLAYASLTGMGQPVERIFSGAHIISVIGIDGGAGSSSIAIGLADELAGYREKKTLYISMELFEALSLGLANINPSAAQHSFNSDGDGTNSASKGIYELSEGGISSGQNGGAGFPRRDISDYLFHLLSGTGRLPASPGGSLTMMQGKSSASSDGSPATLGRLSASLGRLPETQGILPAAPYVFHDELGMMRFAPSLGCNRLCELSGRDFAFFMDSILSELAPDCVVIDWGANPADYVRSYISGSALVLFVSKYGTTKGASGRVSSIADSFDVSASRALSVVSRVPVDEDVFDDNSDIDDLSMNGKGHTQHSTQSGENFVDGNLSTEDFDKDRKGREYIKTLFGKDDFSSPGTENAGILPRANIDEMPIYEDRGGFDTSGGYTRVCLTNTFGTGIKAIADRFLGVHENVQEDDRIYSSGYKDRLHSAYENEDEEGGFDVAL